MEFQALSYIFVLLLCTITYSFYISIRPYSANSNILVFIDSADLAYVLDSVAVSGAGLDYILDSAAVSSTGLDYILDSIIISSANLTIVAYV